MTQADADFGTEQVWNRGPGLGMAATGKALETTGIVIVRVADGQAVEVWQNWDMLGVMQQIQPSGKALTYVA
jgi:predicted ester cyclase